MPLTARRMTSSGRRSSISLSVRDLQAARIAGVAVVQLLRALVARDRDLLGVDDDDEVAGVDVRRVGRLALAAQRVGDLGRQAAEGLALGVDEQPVALAVGRGGDVGLHRGRGHERSPRPAARTGRHHRRSPPRVRPPIGGGDRSPDPSRDRSSSSRSSSPEPLPAPQAPAPRAGRGSAAAPAAGPREAPAPGVTAAPRSRRARSVAFRSWRLVRAAAWSPPFIPCRSGRPRVMHDAAAIDANDAGRSRADRRRAPSPERLGRTRARQLRRPTAYFELRPAFLAPPAGRTACRASSPLVAAVEVRWARCRDLPIAYGIARQGEAPRGPRPHRRLRPSASGADRRRAPRRAQGPARHPPPLRRRAGGAAADFDKRRADWPAELDDRFVRSP